MYGLPNILIEQIIDIKNKYNIELLLFGSRARGNYKENSDIDIAIVTNVDQNIKYQIVDDFNELNTAYKIDIVFMQNIVNEKFFEEITREGKKI